MPSVKQVSHENKAESVNNKKSLLSLSLYLLSNKDTFLHLLSSSAVLYFEKFFSLLFLNKFNFLFPIKFLFVCFLLG